MHNIRHETFPEKTSQQKIVDHVRYVVTHNGDRYGTENVKFFDSKICDNYDAAEDFIREKDQDFYGGYAVRFYDFSKVKSTKKIDELNEKIKEMYAKKKEYAAAHSVKTQKATLIGCSHCGSKLSREHLKGEKCPLCGTDLRAATTLERLTSFDARIKECEKKIKQEQLKAKNKAEVKWLVKYEWHS